MAQYPNLNDLNVDDDMKVALGKMQDKMIDDYNRFMPLTGSDSKCKVRTDMRKRYANGFAYSKGQKYLKVISIDNQTSVLHFINLGNPNFKVGDILKSAGWSTPALNKARGNIFDDHYPINWTGAVYLT